MSASTGGRRFGLVSVAAGLGFVYLFLPIAVIVLFSFNDYKGRFNIAWEGFTSEHWRHAFESSKYSETFVESLKVASVSSVAATILGAGIALALGRYGFRGRGLVDILLVLPLTTPEIVMGSSLFTLFFNAGSDFGFTTVVLAHTMFNISFVAMTVRARIRGMGWSLEEAAADLGSPPWRVFLTVTLPAILPGILAAMLLSFALSVDDYIITSFVAGDSFETFPVRIFNASRVEINAQAHVLATLILVSSVALLAGGSLLGRRRQPS